MIASSIIIWLMIASLPSHSTEAAERLMVVDALQYPDGSAARTVYGNNLMNDYYKLYGAGIPSLLRVEDLDLIGWDLVPERVTEDGLYSTGSGQSLQYLWREKYLHGDTAGNIKMDNFYNPSRLLFGKASRSFQVSAAYDHEGRITDTDYQWTSQSTPFAEYDYRYDRAGNRTGMTVAEGLPGATVTSANTYYYNNSNRMDLERRAGHWRDYAYDEQGNMTSNPEHEYSYDNFGRLVQVDRGAIKFIYSLSGDKLLKIGPGNIVTAYFYSGGGEVLYEAEYKDTGTSLEPIGNDYYIYSDTGLVAQFSGTPSGAPGFVSRFYDNDVGLYQLGARWYDPTIGRFVSPDPIPSSLNQYAYANNNPFVFSDASGLCSDWGLIDQINSASFPTSAQLADQYYGGYLPIASIPSLFEPEVQMYDSPYEDAASGYSEAVFSGLGSILAGGPSVANSNQDAIVAYQQIGSALGVPQSNLYGFASWLDIKARKLPAEYAFSDTGKMIAVPVVFAATIATPGPRVKIRQGGVYSLRNVSFQVAKTGRSKDLIRRLKELKRNQDTMMYHFQPEYITNNYFEQRGLEQILFERYPNAPLNKIRPINPYNPLKPLYMRAAENYLNKIGK